jgi:hypothetical protein
MPTSDAFEIGAKRRGEPMASPARRRHPRTCGGVPPAAAGHADTRPGRRAAPATGRPLSVLKGGA